MKIDEHRKIQYRYFNMDTGEFFKDEKSYHNYKRKGMFILSTFYGSFYFCVFAISKSYFEQSELKYAINKYFKLQKENQMKSNPIICVDFDGVIHSYKSGWHGANVVMDEPVPGAIEWLISFLPEPFKEKEYPGGKPIVCIYSARSDQLGGIKAMQEWLIGFGLPSDYITENILQFPKTKPPAFLTIDDRCIRFNGVFPTENEMVNFIPWFKQNQIYTEGLSFGEAIEAMKRGNPVYRRGWHGKGIFIQIQVPDEHSKMSSPYIYIDTTELESSNPDAPKSRVPWLASQTDMLAEDWEIKTII